MVCSSDLILPAFFLALAFSESSCFVVLFMVFSISAIVPQRAVMMERLMAVLVCLNGRRGELDMAVIHICMFSMRAGSPVRTPDVERWLMSSVKKAVRLAR